MSDAPPGPNFNTLLALRGMVKGMAHGVAEGTLTGKGIAGPESITSRPRKYCKVCGRVFAWIKTRDDIAIEEALCDKCEKTTVKDGWIAIVSESGYAFVTSSKLPDLAGSVVKISDANMAKIASAFELDVKKRDKNE